MPYRSLLQGYIILMIRVFTFLLSFTIKVLENNMKSLPLLDAVQKFCKITSLNDIFNPLLNRGGSGGIGVNPFKTDIQALYFALSDSSRVLYKECEKALDNSKVFLYRTTSNSCGDITAFCIYLVHVQSKGPEYVESIVFDGSLAMEVGLAQLAFHCKKDLSMLFDVSNHPVEHYYCNGDINLKNAHDIELLITSAAKKMKLLPSQVTVKFDMHIIPQTIEAKDNGKV